MAASDAAPLPRLGEVFFDVRGESRSMRLSWYADTGVAVFSIWQGGKCTGTFRLPMDDLSRMIEVLRRGPQPGGRRPELLEQETGRSRRAAGGRGAADAEATQFSLDAIPDSGPGGPAAGSRGSRRRDGYDGENAPGYDLPGYDLPGYDSGRYEGGRHSGDSAAGRPRDGYDEAGDGDHFAGAGNRGYDGGGYDRDGYDGGGYGGGRSGARGPGSGGPGAGGPEAAAYEAGAYVAAAYEAGGYEAAAYEAGGYEVSGPGTGGYDSGAYPAAAAHHAPETDYGGSEPGGCEYPTGSYWLEDGGYEPDATGQHRLTGSGTDGYSQDRFVPPYVRGHGLAYLNGNAPGSQDRGTSQSRRSYSGDRSPASSRPAEYPVSGTGGGYFDRPDYLLTADPAAGAGHSAGKHADQRGSTSGPVEPPSADFPPAGIPEPEPDYRGGPAR